MKRLPANTSPFWAFIVHNKAVISLIAVMLVFLPFIFLKELVLVEKEKELPPVPSDAPYKQSLLEDEVRIEDLVSRMTLREKIGQMALVEKNSIHDIKDVTAYGIGGVLSGAGAKPQDNTPLGWKQMVATFTDASAKSRLSIPVLYGVDAIHGHANVPGAVVFPHAIGLGASRDQELLRKIGMITAQELAATGVNWNFSPNFDLPQDIRWGRAYETFGDDPKIAESLGSAYLTGLQYGQEPQTASSSRILVLGTLKHFIGVGGMLWGSSSNKDFHIDQGTTPEDHTLLQRTYLPPFASGVKSGALSVMAGLNSWGDSKIAASSYLLNSILKEQLHFEGFVVSDWYGVYEIPGGDRKAAVKAINAGVDMVMLPFDYKTFINNVHYAVRTGEIKESRINDAVSRILKAKFALGLFEPETRPQYAVETLGSAEHRAVAREAVAGSLVLLKNENVLPIADHIARINIGGSAAHNVGRQSGAWTVEWQGIDGNWLQGATSILEGIQARADAGTDIRYEVGGNFSTSTEEKAELGIAIVGEAPYAEGWGDVPEPVLSTEDKETIERLKASSEKVLVIIVSGRPLLITDDIQSWDGLVAAWLPGSEGAGVADVLFGDVPFKGKLPLPWPASVTQLPFAPDGTSADRTQPLFPRGFGL